MLHIVGYMRALYDISYRTKNFGGKTGHHSRFSAYQKRAGRERTPSRFLRME
jgi:hypothetical protein